MEHRRNPWVYRGLTLALYLGDALFTPFFSLYFVQAGLSTIETSILLAVVPFSFFLGNLFYSMFETSWKRNVFLIRLIAILEGVSLFLFGLTKSFWLLLPITIMAALHNSCMFGLVDGMGANSAKRRGTPFSTIRVVGSLAYISASIFGYFFLDVIGYSLMFNISGIIIFMCFPISFLLVPYEGEEKEIIRIEAVGEQEEKKPFFKNKNLWLFLIFSGLFFGGLNNYSSIVPIFMNQQGLTPGETAIWTVVRVLVELMLMLLIPLLQKILKTTKNSIILASIFSLSAVLFNASISNFQLTLWLSYIARGLGYGLSLVGMVMLAQEIVGERDCAKACSLSNGCTYVMCGILNLLSPLIYENLGFRFYFWTIFLIMESGIVLLCFIKQKGDPFMKKSPANQ